MKLRFMFFPIPTVVLAFLISVSSFASQKQLGASFALGSAPGSNLTVRNFFPVANFLGVDTYLGLRVGTFQGGKLGTYPSPQISLDEAGLWTLNLAFQAEKTFFSNWVLGLNIDFFGASFASERQGASPQKLNLLLGGKNDRGSLVSEFFVGYQFGAHQIRAGLNHSVQEWKFSSLSNRFQRFMNLGFVGYSYFY
ncbi:MAG: hypothetical protein JNL01_00725 [Bdellovibrionales bacterium]|nr:hypothetical protein [Bdellovibrionales bacterium]